jgi:tetratricopeptide (TPR) repeat protein
LRNDQQICADSKTGLVDQVKFCLHSGEYARAVDLLRGADGFPNDDELSKLEKFAQDGIKRKAEADSLITQSQELFAQQKSAEAIQLLRKAHELDKKNSLARAILANALVEHAQSFVETDWLEAEKLTNQALSLNPAHPTAKTILGLIVDRKTKSSVEDWVSQARKLQSSGDLFAALAWVAEGLAVHPHDPKLLQIQDSIQRDQDARRRQARRGDLEDLRRLQHEIDGAKDVAAKQALAVRIQTVAAKHWTDGEILSIANALLLRLGLVSQESSSASPRSKGATLILHVPRPNAPVVSSADAGQITESKPNKVAESPILPENVLPGPVVAEKTPTISVAPSKVSSSEASQNNDVPSSRVPENNATSSEVSPRVVPLRTTPRAVKPPGIAPANIVAQKKVLTSTPESQTPTPNESADATEASPSTAKVTDRSLALKQPSSSNFTSMILVSVGVAIVAVAATLFFARKYYAPPVAKLPVVASTVSEPTAPASAVPAPAASTSTSASVQTTAEPSAPESSQSASPLSSDTNTGKVTSNDRLNARPNNDQPNNEQPPAAAGHEMGSLLVVAGQDNARVFLDGKLQRQLTRAGQLRLANLEPKDYVVQVSKDGFQDPSQQEVHIRKGEQAMLAFNLQPQPRTASLNIQGGVPGTAVFVDQSLVGTIQPDHAFSVSSVNPGDHTVELRKERFKSRQFKEHFVAGGTISLAAVDAALEAAPGELKITFAPADAKVAIVKGDLLTAVNSGVPLNLAAGTYTLTARTADRFTRSFTVEISAGQSKTLDLSLAPNGMSKWDDPGAWKQEGDSFLRKGGDFVLYSVVPVSGTFIFSAMPAKGHLLQWVFNYTDPQNYVLFQMDDNNFYRSVIRNGKKSDEIIVPDKGDKKTFRTFHIHVSPTEIVHEIKNGNSWTVVDRWTQPGTNLSLGKFGFYVPGSDQVAVSSFAHYADLNIR